MSASAPELVQVGSNLMSEDMFAGQTGTLYDERNQARTELDYWKDVVNVRQPKAEIADYVESQGINVPTRYDSLDEVRAAIAADETVIIRSEHPGEYDQFSGLFHSPQWNLESIGSRYDPVAYLLRQSKYDEEVIDELKRQEFTNQYGDIPTPVRYAQLHSLKTDEFADQLGYSYWKHIRGANITVVADDTVTGRYHIAMHQGPNINRGWLADVDSGKADVDTQYTGLNRQLIDFYEAVRTLDAFDTNNCPTIEMQLDDAGDLFFLQYMKGRQFEPSQSLLDARDYRASDGWVRADTVRGALGSFMTLHAGLFYPDSYGLTGGLTLPQHDEAAFDKQTETALLETMTASRMLSINTRGKEAVYAGLADMHTQRSQWFRPQSSVSLPPEKLDQIISLEQRRYIMARALDEGMARIRIDAASDGHSGFVRLNQDGDPIITE